MSTQAPDRVEPDAALLLDSLPVPLLEVGAGNAVLALNMAAEEFFGMSRQQIKAGGMAEIAPPDHPIYLLLAHLRQRGGV